MRLSYFLGAGLIPLLAPAFASGQDVVLLGERYGARPPAGYFREMARDPGAYGFRRGRAGPLGGGLRDPARFEASASVGGPARGLGPRDVTVEGTFVMPVLLGLFSDSPTGPPFGRDQIDTDYFSAGPHTVRSYYAEASGGRVTLVGDVREWATVSLTQDEVAGGQSGLESSTVGAGGIGNFVRQLVLLQTGIDWGLYDNDGVDGVPNSGDDDGFVDAVALMHPTRGAECGGSGQQDRIWAHKWNLTAALGTTVPTSTPAAGGGVIRVDDYFVQGVVSCSGSELNEIGVFTHETGHAFGLPDLYDTDASDGIHGGAGTWDLMAAGAWGCSNRSPELPCQMGAWSKSALGWVDVVTLADGMDHGSVSIPPVLQDHVVYRIDADDGSGEYFLLENRRRHGFDAELRNEGLLIWHIDPDWVIDRWESNLVNAAPRRGVWLREADGRDDLGSTTRRGDAGDPFPGSTGNTVFHAASSPASTSHAGTPSGMTLLDITDTGTDIELRVLTRRSTVTLTSVGVSGTTGLFTVDGASLEPQDNAYSAPPFVSRTVEAFPGEEQQQGVRVPFSRWADDGSTERTRVVVTPVDDTTLAAVYAGLEHRLSVDVSGGVAGISPGTVRTLPLSPDFWFPAGQDVILEAVPTTGFGFVGWTGTLGGLANPASLTLDDPVFGGVAFEMIYGIESASVRFGAAAQQEAQLDVRHGTPPVAWSIAGGSLPAGLRMTDTGRILGAPLVSGTFDIQLRARDAIGLTAEGPLSLVVDPPTITPERAATFFLLSEPGLTPEEMMYLDRYGNGTSGYDLGDFRAWALAVRAGPFTSASGEAEPTGLPEDATNAGGE